MTDRLAHNLAEDTGQGEAGTLRQARPNRVLSGRVRIVGSLVASVAVALGISIAISYLIALQRLDQRIDRDLTQEVREVAAFAEIGTDPVTARPFTDVEALLRASIERNVVGRNETMPPQANPRSTPSTQLGALCATVLCPCEWRVRRIPACSWSPSSATWNAPISTV